MQVFPNSLYFDDAKRRRMEELLQSALNSELVILSSVPEPGTAEAVLSQLNGFWDRAVWIRMSELDNQPAYFWPRFADCTLEWAPALAGKLRAAGFPRSKSELRRISMLLDEHISAETPFVWIFDEFHLVESGPVCQFISYLTQAQLSGVIIVIIARTGSRLSLPGTEGMARISDSRLRLSPEAARTYCKAAGIHAAESELTAIYRFSEGWGPAVCLMCVHLPKGRLITQDDVGQAANSLLQLIRLYVYTPLDPTTQQALALLSLLDTFPADIAVAAAQGNPQPLIGMLNSHVLISFHPHTGTYSFHPLLSLFLRGQTASLPREKVRAFLLGAARWHESCANYRDAVQCYLSCDNFDPAYQVLLRQGFPYPSKEDAQSLVRLLDRFPAGFYESRPMLSLIRIYYEYYAGRHQHTHLALTRLRRELQKREFTQEVRAALGETCIALALVRAAESRLDFVELLREADRLLPGGSTMYQGRQAPLLNNGNALVVPSLRRGMLARAQAVHFEASPLLSRICHGYGAGLQYLAAAEISYYQGDFNSAAKQISQAIALAVPKEQWDVVCNSYYLRMRIAMAAGSLPDVEAYLEKLKRYSTLMRPGGDSMWEIARTTLYIKLGLPGKVSGWMADDTLLPHEHYQPKAAREYVLKAGYLVATDRYDEAFTLIETGMRLCEEGKQWFSYLKLLILKSIVHGMLGDMDESATCLALAYELSHGDRIITPYVEYGRVTQHLLQRLRASPGHNLPGQWLDQIEARAKSYAKNIDALIRDYSQKHRTAGSLGDSLTKRERGVLHCVCQGKTNGDIADELGIQLSTVKGTLNRIYAKLGAKNRADAARIALEEKLWD